MDGWAKIVSELARGNQTPLQLLPKCQSQQLSSFVSRDLRLGQHFGMLGSNVETKLK